MIRYVKCPRCELNYIDEEKQEYCDVCIAEMRGNKLQFADLEDEDYEALDADIETTEICTICGVNPVRYGEKVCDSCKQTGVYEEEEEVDIDKDEEWKNYIDDEDDTDLTIDDETLQEELDSEMEEEEEESENEDDFFDDELDSLSDLEDDEFDDDEDEDEDDDDDF